MKDAESESIYRQELAAWEVNGQVAHSSISNPNPSSPGCAPFIAFFAMSGPSADALAAIILGPCHTGPPKRQNYLAEDCEEFPPEDAYFGRSRKKIWSMPEKESAKTPLFSDS